MALVATVLWGSLTLMGASTLFSPHAPLYLYLPASLLATAGFSLFLSTRRTFALPAAVFAVMLTLAVPCFLLLYTGGI